MGVRVDAARTDDPERPVGARRYSRRSVAIGQRGQHSSARLPVLDDDRVGVSVGGDEVRVLVVDRCDPLRNDHRVESRRHLHVSALLAAEREQRTMGQKSETAVRRDRERVGILHRRTGIDTSSTRTLRQASPPYVISSIFQD